MERDDAVLTHTFGRVGDSAACVLFGRAFRCVRVGVLPWEHHREHESRSNEKRVQCHIYSPTHANNPSAHRPTLPLVLPTPPNLLGSRTFDWSATTYVLYTFTYLRRPRESRCFLDFHLTNLNIFLKFKSVPSSWLKWFPETAWSCPRHWL